MKNHSASIVGDGLPANRLKRPNGAGRFYLPSKLACTYE
ncbi:hypothetical protein PTUN_a1815 [Pseudoalteromonas tunicata]|nr:hypothetical protein PTUN_a1815 [Pseudoalteromonas tunicata]